MPLIPLGPAGAIVYPVSIAYPPPMKLLAAHVRELLDELAPLVHGATVIDVAPQPPRDVVLVLEPAEGTFPPGEGPKILRVRLSANPDAPRLHLVQDRVFRHEGSVGPFFHKVVEDLEGTTLVRLEQVRGDRIVLVEFRGGGERRALVLELTGRHANLVLLGPGDRVLALCAPAPKSKDGPRLVVDQEWAPPGGRAGAPPAGEVPSLSETFPDPAERPRTPAGDRAPLSWRIEAGLGAVAEERLEDQARKKLLSRVARKLERARSWHAGLEKRRRSGAEAERVMQDGELLKVHQAELKRGMKKFVVQDWYSEDSPERTLNLDPKLGPTENVEKFFARYKKLERARLTAAEELEGAEAKLAALAELEERAKACEDPVAVDAEAVAAGLLDPQQQADPRKRKAPVARKAYRVFHACNGSEIWVGRTARDNDELTVRLSRGSDLWLHTADVPGSHVLLRLERGTEPDEQEVLDAAHLAIHFSPQRGTDRAPVHVARKKHVHKPRGAKPGLVTLSGGRILQVRMQQDRLQRLLRTDQ